MKAAAETLLLFVYSSLFILIIQSQRCIAKPNCTSSACGIVPNISHPFRLKSDPGFCGDPGGELACENNATFLYLNSHKYYVKAINYINQTIRLVDASMNNHTCSFPTSSAYFYSGFTFEYPYTSRNYFNSPTNLMSCPHPLKNSSPFTNTTHCQTQTSNSRFTYIKMGRMKASDVPETCRVDVIVLTSRRLKDLKNVSLEEIRLSLLYGFELDFSADCRASRTAWEAGITHEAKRVANIGNDAAGRRGAVWLSISNTPLAIALEKKNEER